MNKLESFPELQWKNLRVNKESPPEHLTKPKEQVLDAGSSRMLLYTLGLAFGGCLVGSCWGVVMLTSRQKRKRTIVMLIILPMSKSCFLPGLYNIYGSTVFPTDPEDKLTRTLGCWACLCRERRLWSCHLARIEFQTTILSKAQKSMGLQISKWRYK